MFDIIFALKSLDLSYLKDTKDDWEQLLKTAKIIDIVDAGNFDNHYSNGMRARTYLIREDHSFYEARIGRDVIDEISLDWNAFVVLNKKSREIIIETLSEMSRGMQMLRFFRRDFEEYINERNIKYIENCVTSEAILHKEEAI